MPTITLTDEDQAIIRRSVQGCDPESHPEIKNVLAQLNEADRATALNGLNRHLAFVAEVNLLNRRTEDLISEHYGVDINLDFDQMTDAPGYDKWHAMAADDHPDDDLGTLAWLLAAEVGVRARGDGSLPVVGWQSSRQ